MNTIINKKVDFHKYCDRLEGCKIIAFDTEFVGEDYYRPMLCLIQVATEHGIDIIDAIKIDDVGRFWQVLIEGEHETILHAGQHELQFCLASTGDRPRKMFDVQLAAGLIGWDYPASYSNLVSRLLNVKLKKSQSRTDWRRRPLNDAQLKYAAEDVVHLIEMHEKLKSHLVRLGREEWMVEEIDRLERRVRRNDSDERWLKTSGISNLVPAQLAIVKSIWMWRERKAEELDRPAKRILRDDLMVELARLGSGSEDKIKSIREMTQQRFSRFVKEIAEAIDKALSSNEDSYPSKTRKPRNPHYGLAGQFLNVVLSSLCLENEVASGLVGSIQDVHELIAWNETSKMPKSKKRSEQLPFLATGWRGEVIGNQLNSALNGDVQIRIGQVKGELVPVIEKT